MTVHARAGGREGVREEGGGGGGGGEKPFYITSAHKYRSGQDVLMTATSFHSTSSPAAPLYAQFARTRKLQHTYTHTQSYTQPYTGLPFALQSFLCMPKITDLMAYLFPSS